MKSKKSKPVPMRSREPLARATVDMLNGRAAQTPRGREVRRLRQLERNVVRTVGKGARIARAAEKRARKQAKRLAA